MSGATLIAFINGSTGGAGAGVYDFTEPGTGEVIIPTGATGVTVQVWGSGGGGGFGYLGFIAPGEPEVSKGFRKGGKKAIFEWLSVASVCHERSHHNAVGRGDRTIVVFEGES